MPGWNSYQKPSEYSFQRTKFNSNLNDRAKKNVGLKWDKLLYLEIIKLYEGAVQNLFPLQLNITEQNGLVIWLKQEMKK